MLIFYLIKKKFMNSWPLLYYLKYFILYVDYKILQNYVFIKRICFWCIKKYNRLLHATRKIPWFWQGLLIVWVWGGEMVAILCETAGKTCFSGVLSNFCSERNSFTEQRALSSLLSCSSQRLKHLHMGDVNSIFKLLSDKNEKCRWEQSYRGKCRLMLPFNKIF